MKKILAILTLLAMFVIAPSAIAGRVKPPDRLCLEWENGSTYHHLSIDKNGKYLVLFFHFLSALTSWINQENIDMYIESFREIFDISDRVK